MNATMKTKICLATLAICTLALTNCEDQEFLKENPPSLYTNENIFSTSAQVDQILVNNYKDLRDLFTGISYKYNGTDMYDVPSNRMTSQFNDYSKINPLHSRFLNTFSSFYKMINQSNLALYAVDLPQIKWGSEAEKKIYCGTGKVLPGICIL
jgi:hypothetical protein